MRRPRNFWCLRVVDAFLYRRVVGSREIGAVAESVDEDTSTRASKGASSDQNTSDFGGVERSVGRAAMMA